MTKNLVIFVLVILFVLIAFIYKFFVSRPVLNSNSAVLKIGEQEFRVEVVKDDLGRIRGLSGRKYLAQDQGMLFIFDTVGNHGFWMKGMKFPIDIVWVKGDRVVGFAENVPPEPGKSIFTLKTYYPPEEVDQVLELNAGTVEKYNLQVGDSIEVNSGL